MMCPFKAQQLDVADDSLLLQVGMLPGCIVTGLGWDRTQGLGFVWDHVLEFWFYARVGLCCRDRVGVRTEGLCCDSFEVLGWEA